ncbi:SDR family oxidoreductase [Microbacterium sediminicola]|uniref:SDR family oxidoreductase n=1 Tax=Microbacterium sediminicola TaxID=415210 RepID=A0ABP4U1C4_9MICO
MATAGEPWLTDKVALVTGGGLSGPDGGVGFAFAWLCARNGARVALLDRDRHAAERAVAVIEAAGGSAMAFDVDVTDQQSCERAFADVAAAWGPIDVLGNSIGGGGTEPLFEGTLAQWQRAIDLNLTSAWIIMRSAQRHMNDGGSIVHVSSGAVEGRGPGLAYTVAKTGLEKLCVGAAASLAPRGIRVNCVRVGMIWGAFAARGISQAQREARARNVILRREGNVWDIASAALFLSTSQSRWITGQILPVDGGGGAPAQVGQVGQAFDEEQA